MHILISSLWSSYEVVSLLEHWKGIIWGLAPYSHVQGTVYIQPKRMIWWYLSDLESEPLTRLNNQTKWIITAGTTNSLKSPFWKILLFAYSLSVSCLFSCKWTPFGWAMKCLASGGELELVQVNFDSSVSSFVVFLILVAKGCYMTQFGATRCKRKFGKMGLYRNFTFLFWV